MTSDKFILWDNDGVLVDTEYWYYRSTQQALAEIGVTLDESIYLQMMAQGHSCWELALAAGVDSNQVESKRNDRDVYYQGHLVNEDIEIPGVVATLKQLSESYRMAIVTTSKRADFDLVHNNRDIVSFMEFVITREDYRLAKPEPEPYLLGLTRFGAAAHECVAIEDSQRGLQSAMAAGIDCGVVLNEFTATHDFGGARFCVDSIRELPDILNERGIK